MAGQGYRHAGDIEVNTLQLISAGNQVIDVGELVVQLDIFQSLRDPFMRCEIVLDDSSAILNTIQGGFTGGELLVVSWKSADESLPEKNNVFVLHEVSGRTKMNDNREVYMLNGSSVEMYQDAGYKVSRAFGSGTGTLISTMVEEIVTEFLYNENAKSIYTYVKSDVEKTIEVDPTSGNQKYVAPMIKPTELISRLASEADNDNQNPFYFFYEDSAGFKFKDLTNLVASDPIGQYVYQPKNFDEGSDFYKINSYSVNRQNSFYNNVSSGMLKNRNYQLDIMRRQWNVKDTDYSKVAAGFPKLQDSLAPGLVGDDSNPAMFVTISRTGHDIDSRFGGEAPLPRKSTEFAGNKLSLSKHITNVELEVELPGDSEIDVGKTIILRIPSSSSTDDQNGADDGTLSGKYLITRVRHKTEGTTGGKYQTIIRCVKEAGIPAENFNDVIAEASGSKNTGSSGGGSVGLDAFGGIGDAVAGLDKAASVVNGLEVPIPSVGGLLNQTPINNAVAAVTGKVGGALNQIASSIVSDKTKFSITQPFGDGGLDSVFKEALGNVGGAVSSLQNVLNTGDISGIKDKLLAGLPDVADIATELDKLGGSIDIAKVANIEDAKKVLELAKDELKAGSTVSMSNGTDYEVKEIEDNVGKKTKVMVPANAPVVNKTFLQGYQSSQYFSYPEGDYLAISDDIQGGKYGEGSKITIIDAYYNEIQEEITYTVYKNPITGGYAGINLADEAEVKRYRNAGFNV